MKRTFLLRYVWLSIAAAVVTILLKGCAWQLTGSVGLLSDAMESLVNLLGASIALVMLTIASRPADEEHPFGHSKAEYFSSGAEGALILVAAVSIAVTAFNRFIHPMPIEQAGIGLGVSALASGINLVVARVLLRAGKRHESITLEADGHHLMTDVWTSVGVIGGIGAVALTGWQILDPIVAIAVAGNIVRVGIKLVRRSVLGLMDSSLPPEELNIVLAVLETYRIQGVSWHALRTRQAAAKRFVSLHVLVPGAWSVSRGHKLLEQMETDLRGALPNMIVDTHLEPKEGHIPEQDVV